MAPRVPRSLRALACALAAACVATGCAAVQTADIDPAATAATAESGSPAKAGPIKAAPPKPARTASERPAPAVAPAPMAAPASPAALKGPMAPVWQVGDQWAFRWESTEGQGDYVWTVDRIDTLDGVEQYVIRTGPREIFFRRSDLATSLETTAGNIDRRNSPPRLAFSWPLAAGTMWRQRYTEESGGRAATERSIAWKVEGEERVRVEAGTFQALKIVARHAPTPEIMYEMWYAPEARQWVRLKEHFPAGIRYRELTALSLRS